MIEKYNTLSLAELKAIAKTLGIKNTSSMRKAQLAQILSDLEEKQKEGAAHPEDAAGEKKEQEVKEETQSHTQVHTGSSNTSSSVSVPAGHTSLSGHSTEGGAARVRAVRNASGRISGRNLRGTVTYSPRSAHRYDTAEGDSRSETPGRAETYGRSEAPGRAETYGRGEAPGRAETYGRSEAPGRAETYGRGEASGRAETYSRGEASGRGETSGRGEYGSYRVDDSHMEPALEELDSGNMAHGILEVMPDGFGFIRCENYLPGDNDIYVSPAQIRRFNLKTGDIIEGNIKIKLPTEKFSALLFVRAVNGFHPAEASRRMNFEDMTPIFPNSRIRLETERASVPMRIVDLVSPIGKGQRGMIVAPPKTGKTTLLKQVAKSVHANYPEMNMIILLIDERPEEVTDIKEYIEGDNVEVIYSTFDELPEHHKRVSEMVLERAKRLVEHKKDVVILLDSITRLARAYNLTVPPSGRTLSGGLDPAALHMPKRFFGAARNMREGGSLTVLATALVETGSKMDDVVYEEFKGTGNMELVLDRRLSEKRIFPAIDIARSGTRREELLLSKDELESVYMMRKALSGMKSDEALERILEMFMRTRSNKDFIAALKRTKFVQ